MTKAVLISPAAYRWLQRHRFASEEVIIGIILNCPTSERKYTDDNRFQITFKRRKNGKFTNITLWVHERQDSFYVGKIHSEKA
ncbi:MAG: hypothetical protein ABSC20_05245 [Candidatus Bathyarchaeia archaeon]|jgi:hypothetical protein